MFTLFHSQKNYPQIKFVNINMVQSYLSKFEESIRNFEEVQKEGL